MQRTIAVIGGGISGLAAAHRLRELDPDLDVVVLEARERLGGVLETRRHAGCLMEAAADGFLTQPDSALRLCQQLGLSHELIATDPQRRHASVIRNGRLEPIPEGFLVMAPTRLGPLLSSRILSWPGKLRMALEYLLPPRTIAADESLAAFVRRRFGNEAYDRLVQPLLGGIYAADCEQLSLAATMPRFQQLEREHGGVIRGLRSRTGLKADAHAGGVRYGQFAALRTGMGRLIESLAGQLPTGSVRKSAPVETLQPLGDRRWRLEVGSESPEELDVDGVIVALPAHRAAALTGDFDPQLAELLAAIRYNSCAVVSLVYRREQIDHPLDGCGFVVPLLERRHILSGSYASLKYAGRAPEGSVLLRVFVGGGCHHGLMQLPDLELADLAHREVADVLHISGGPDHVLVARHTRAMPEYRVGHQAQVAAIQHRLQRHPTLALAGNAYQGVGVPHCIASGAAAAERVLAELTPNPRPSGHELDALVSV